MGLPDTNVEGNGVMDRGPGVEITSADLSVIAQRDPPDMGVRNQVIRCPHPDC